MRILYASHRTTRALAAVGVLLLGIVVSSAMAVILAADSVMDQARQELLEYEQGTQRHIEYHSEIRNAIGYGGFIHSFKNFLLRGDAEYRGAVTEDHHRLAQLIDRFETVATDEERLAIEPLRGVLASYIENFRRAQSLQADGHSPEEIDRALSIDDGPALEALNLLEDQWLESTAQGATRLNDAILRGKNYVEIGWFFVPLFFIVGLILFWLGRQIINQSNLHAKLRQESEGRRGELEAEIAERKRLELRLRQMASTDPLTELSNRRHFLDTAEKEVARTRRYGASLSVVMLDIDYFKGINDRYGHAAGDEAIRTVAEVCESGLRKGIDLAGRLGGEEFALLLPATDLCGAMMFAERLREAMLEIEIDGVVQRNGLTCSFGVAQWDEKDGEIDSTLKRADAALYVAKCNGRNRVERCAGSVCPKRGEGPPCGGPASRERRCPFALGLGKAMAPRPSRAAS